jgi:hypothetical protein
VPPKGSRTAAAGAVAGAALATEAAAQAAPSEPTADELSADDAVAARLSALGALEPSTAWLSPGQTASEPEPEASTLEPERPAGTAGAAAEAPTAQAIERYYDHSSPVVEQPPGSASEPEAPAYGSTAENAAVGNPLGPAPEQLAPVSPLAASTGAAVGAAAVQPAALADATTAAEPSKFDRRLERIRADPNSGVSDATAIGAATALFDCPKCSRPLPVGTSVCPECKTRLIGRRTARRVWSMVGAALVAVVAVALGMTAVLAMSGGSTNGTGTVPSHAPSAGGSTGSAAPTETASATPPGIPAGAEVALSGTTLVNTRMTQDGAALARVLADKKSQTIDVARAIRVVAADAQQGLDMSGRLATWTEATAVKAQLDAFYQGIADTARDAFRASLTDDATYRQAGARLVTEIRKVDDVDAASRTLATSVGLQLPALGDPGTVISPPPAP